MDREQTTLRMTAETKESLMREALALGISFNAYVLMLIDKGRRYQPQCCRDAVHIPQQTA